MIQSFDRRRPDRVIDPAQGPMMFWRNLDQARALLDRAGTQVQVAALLSACARQLAPDPRAAPGRRHVLEQFCLRYGLPLPEIVADPLPPAKAALPRTGHHRLPLPDLPPVVSRIPDAALPGHSLVTCCRNRTANLLRALPSWLALPLDDIVVVDWSSEEPVAQSLARAGISDPRLTIARVEAEPRWILSHAFNLGFRLARHDTILKTDADIVLAPDFLARNPLPQGQFIAGNWRTALPGQEYVNGFLLIARADLAAVNGFNEYITSYGWDDDDLYLRLLATGLLRRDVAPGSLRHLDHDDGARLDPGARGPGAGPDRLTHSPHYLARTNRLITSLLPLWDPARPLSEFTACGRGAEMVLHRAAPAVAVPDRVRRIAQRMAACEMIGWAAGPAVYDLAPEALDRLIALAPAEGIGPLHLDLARAAAPDRTLSARRFLLVDLPLIPEDPGDLGRLRRLAPDREMVLRLPTGGKTRSDLAILPTGPLPPGTVEVTLPLPKLIEADIAHLPLGQIPDLARPDLLHQPETLFIEVQHGLGNRLRAMASAAAIARATERELVVIWTPDPHCEARLGDLIDWPGPVLEGAHCPETTRFLSYMEAEPGARKDASLPIESGQDLWVRSAYVLNHPASTWAAENQELQRLRPAAAVRDLLRGFPEQFDIALHIRHEGAAGPTSARHDRVENWTADADALIRHGRLLSAPDRFSHRLRLLLKDRASASCFLAADQAETYAEFAATFGKRLHFLPRVSYDRSVGQLQHALADMLLLSRGRHLLCSNWSSFSEVALRLAQRLDRHETAGIDF